MKNVARRSAEEGRGATDERAESASGYKPHARRTISTKSSLLSTAMETSW